MLCTGKRSEAVRAIVREDLKAQLGPYLPALSLNRWTPTEEEWDVLSQGLMKGLLAASEDALAYTVSYNLFAC